MESGDHFTYKVKALDLRDPDVDEFADTHVLRSVASERRPYQLAATINIGHSVDIGRLRLHAGDARRHDKRAERLADKPLRAHLPYRLREIHHRLLPRERDGARRPPAERRALRALLRGVGEAAEMVELHAPQIGHELSETRLGLAWEAGHYRRPKRNPGNDIAQELGIFSRTSGTVC